MPPGRPKLAEPRRSARLAPSGWSASNDPLPCSNRVDARAAAVSAMFLMNGCVVGNWAPKILNSRPSGSASIPRRSAC